ncbi:DUF4199 domain-containing protein [uncultured Draconibacterium sp.]|uniref:DUF4199 domain-containing protein n=1 Tax=uncultured Draconibacterium sp. TaxID=1573823 RepID=UPI0025FEAC67|nr:DUF4199 domain-containing protein [uncultured Draconibacterium sp.]
MEQKSSPLVKSSLTYGTYLGLISILISVVIWAGSIMESMGLFGSAIIGILMLVINFVLMLIFAKSYRNKEFGGYISFADVFKFMLLVVVVSTVISIVYNYIFHSFIAPDYMENLMAVMQQKTMAFMESKGVPEAQIDKALEKFEESPSILKTLRQTALNGLIFGVIVGLIVSAIVKKKVEDSY